MKERLLSIDILRGMTIFFMIVVNTPGTWSYVYAPLQHASWDGCTPTDLVFPFFVFIVGLSMSFSFRKFEKADRSTWVNKILRRTFLIFLVGLLLNYYPFFNKSLADLRIFGVLQRIALAYGIGALLVVFLSKKALYWSLPVILFGYWFILLLFGGINPLSLEDNVVRYLDLYLVGESHVYHGYGIPFDPEGLLSTLPTVGTVLTGYFAGMLIQKYQGQFLMQINSLIFYGLAGVALGVLWNFLGFPINKPIWSSSYVLFSAGLASLLFSLLIWIIDVKDWKSWAYVFRAFGLNPLISYVMSGLVIKTLFLIDIQGINPYAWIYQHFFQPVFGNYLGSLVQALTYTMLIWLFAWWLYLNKKVIKL